jgi:hypothetical protein
MDVEAAVVALIEAGSIPDGHDLLVVRPVYITLSGPGGLYEIPFVDRRGSYGIVSYIDQDASGEYDPGETAGCYQGQVAFADEVELDSVDVMLCGESLRGSISGVVDSAVVSDTLKVTVVARSLADSAAVHTGITDGAGAFSMTCVEPGRYLVEAFYDLNANKRRDMEDTISVELADTVTVESCSAPTRLEITFDEY